MAQNAKFEVIFWKNFCPYKKRKMLFNRRYSILLYMDNKALHFHELMNKNEFRNLWTALMLLMNVLNTTARFKILFKNVSLFAKNAKNSYFLRLIISSNQRNNQLTVLQTTFVLFTGFLRGDNLYKLLIIYYLKFFVLKFQRILFFFIHL